MQLTNFVAKSIALLSIVGCVVGLEELKIIVLKEIPEAECTVRSAPGDRVSVHYEGTLEDGTVFDSSYQRDTPIVFQLGTGQVIAGWDQGLTRMCVGEIRKLIIPPHLAYGDGGIGPIPPKSTLIFTSELVDVVSTEKSDETDQNDHAEHDEL